MVIDDDDAGIGTDEIADKPGNALHNRHRKREIVPISGKL
jgi:hypothetical protein